MPHVYFVTGLEYGAPDNETIYLTNALKDRDIASKVEAWDDPEVDWGKSCLAINRTTSTYALKPNEFLEWAQRVETVTTLWNSRKVIEWNYHKGYLLELQKAGVSIPPTILVKQESKEPISYHLEDKNWYEIIIKPAITVGSLGLKRIKSDSPEAETHLQSLIQSGYTQVIPNAGEYTIPKGDALIQQYLPEIITAGEASLIYFGGEYSHSVIKKVKSGDFRAHPLWGASVEAYEASAKERQVADSAIDVVGESIEYARIDMLMTKDGPVIIEVELIEPWLFFDFFPNTVETYVDHIANYVKTRA